MKFALTFFFLVYFTEAVISQKIGINLVNPEEHLHVNGNIKFDSLIQTNDIKVPIIRAYGTVGARADTFYIKNHGSENWSIETIQDVYECFESGQTLDFDYGLIALQNGEVDSARTIITTDVINLSVTTHQSVIDDGKIKIYALYNGISCFSTLKEDYHFKIESW